MTLADIAVTASLLIGLPVMLTTLIMLLREEDLADGIERPSWRSLLSQLIIVIRRRNDKPH